MAEQPNKLGWIQSMSFAPRQDLIEITTHVDRMANLIGGGISEIDFVIEGICFQTTGVLETFHRWMEGGIPGATFEREWRCLYCTSPNSIRETHCSQCGAPRSFIL